MGRLSYEFNRLDDAGRYIHQCIDLSQQWGDSDLEASAFAMLARLEQARNNPDQARVAMWRADQIYLEHPQSPHRSILVRSDLARVWLAQGNLEKLSQFIQKNNVKINDEIPYQREPDYVLLLRFLLAQSDNEAAITLSNRLLQQAMTAGRMGLAIETLVLQALALFGMKDAEGAQAALEKALSLARPEGYVRVFMDEGEAMTRLLCQVQSRRVGNSYAAVILAGIGKGSGMTPPSMQLLIEPLTTREVEVLQLIKAGLSNQDIGKQLFISIATVKRHISNIYSKLGVTSRTQAVAIGKELKIFE